MYLLLGIHNFDGITLTHFWNQTTRLAAFDVTLTPDKRLDLWSNIVRI